MTSLAMVRWQIGDVGRRAWHAVMPHVIDTLAPVIAGVLPFTIGYGFERLRFSTGGLFLLTLSLALMAALFGVFIASFTMKDREQCYSVPRALLWIGWPASTCLVVIAMVTSSHRAFWFSWFPVHLVLLFLASYAMSRYADEVVGRTPNPRSRRRPHGA